MAEACIPSVNVDDLGSIFEEHRVCKSVSVGGLNTLRLVDQSAGGVYGEEDRRFIFSSALVGIKSKARFKISNTKKVCTGSVTFAAILRSIQMRNE